MPTTTFHHDGCCDDYVHGCYDARGGSSTLHSEVHADYRFHRDCRCGDYVHGCYEANDGSMPLHSDFHGHSPVRSDGAFHNCLEMHVHCHAGFLPVRLHGCHHVEY